MSGDQVEKVSPRQAMPNVARLVDAARLKWGREHVNECITRGVAGEPDWFYAFENGMVQGTPFKADSVAVKALQLSVAMGGRFAMVMRPAEGKGALDGQD